MEEVTPVLEEKERSASYKPVFVTEITDDLHFYVQDVETGECCVLPCLHLTGPKDHLRHPQVSPGVDIWQAQQSSEDR